jgi:hypothetical protein
MSCGGYGSGSTSSNLKTRVLASQSVSTPTTFGALFLINGFNDTLPSFSPLSGGSAPGLMALSPSHNIVAVIDSSSNTVFANDMTTQKSIGSVHLLGPTSSIVVPTASPIGYAAVPNASITGFAFLGAVEAMNFSINGTTNIIAVNNAQTVVAASSQANSNSTSVQLLVFSNDSDSVAVLNPGNAVPPVDFSCYDNSLSGVCTVVPGFNRPVYGIINGNTAYILNCGFECGGSQQASVQTLDLSTLTAGPAVQVNGATFGFLVGSTLYVAGNGSPTGPLCSSLTSPSNPKTAATYCGTLDIVDLTTMTDPYYNNPSAEIAIPDGYHNKMDMSLNGELFVGSHDCTNIGNVANPSGEVRGCLAIFNTTNNALTIPQDNGDVNGLQSFTTRYIEYVSEGGNLRVYDTTRNVLLIDQFLPNGTINIPGYVKDVRAVDFF